MLELHGSADPATLKLLLCLEELGLDYAYHEIDLPGLANWSPAHRALAAQGEFPVLRTEDLILSDATIALLYLAEGNPTPKLLPSNLVDRYDVQALNDVLDGALLDGVNLLGWHRQTTAALRTSYYDALGKVPGRQALAGWSAVWSDAESDRLKRATEKIAGGIQKMEQVLADREWLVGTNFTLADINAFALVEGLGLAAPDLLAAREQPHLTGWLDRMQRRPAVKTALAHAGRPDGQTVFAPPR